MSHLKHVIEATAFATMLSFTAACESPDEPAILSETSTPSTEHISDSEPLNDVKDNVFEPIFVVAALGAVAGAAVVLSAPERSARRANKRPR